MRFTVDTELMAVRDTEAELYAGFATLGITERAARLLNEGIDLSTEDLHWGPRGGWEN